ncbi:alpha/beta fold hydrolase [Actinoplanes couchii]|uniref:Serine aminopeptidase S33 domain-containing protein n=1 Tax=Actinoplanes couchii TaxID=403638 RepID=A0ABQ3XFQ1_9ACTN|nr:alpha/beta fold hydrolase [Actinoplanes couchii]MDR6321742.1 putative alpha/beta hydrolase [Actinoplanes couchii]GID57301.1 hypothetical protein Aco03nite_057050 [Actinoplanes couchii]
MTQPAPIVLVSPAMGIGSRYYRLLVAEFEARGWAARALTRRGFEPDSPPASRAHDWSYADEIEDMAKAVAEARAGHPGRPVILLGHSLGGQLALGHQLQHTPADGMVTVGTSLPWHRDFPLRGAPLVVQAAVIVPAMTGLFGYLPKPSFGGPGARTMMREWARMALTGRPPFPAPAPAPGPALIVSLEGDRLAPARAVDTFTRLLDADTATRWHFRTVEVPPGASNDHIGWARKPGPVVDRILTWWSSEV